MRVVYNVHLGSQFGLNKVASETATYEDDVQYKFPILFKQNGL